MRLKDTKAGASLVRAWLEHPPYFVANCVLPTTSLLDTADATQKAVLSSKNAAESVFSLWQSMAYGFAIHEAVEPQLRRIADGFNNAFGGGVLGKPIILAHDFDTGLMRLQPNDQAIWAPWALAIPNGAARIWGAVTGGGVGLLAGWVASAIFAPAQFILAFYLVQAALASTSIGCLIVAMRRIRVHGVLF